MISIRQVPASTVGLLAAAFMLLVLLASLTTDLALRLPLIYYKQRRSRVSGLHLPYLHSSGFMVLVLLVPLALGVALCLS